ncbi:MAG: NFACT family protein [Fimbriimonadales bacterium]|nr:NFACT family protein [Fimbriimonadales bacterium]
MGYVASKPAPFDSLVLRAVCREASSLVGMRLRKVVQVDRFSLWLRFGSAQTGSALLVSADPQYPRMYVSSVLAGVKGEKGAFVQLLGDKLEHKKLIDLSSPRFDRIAYLHFGHPDEVWTLVAELIGTHSNLWLVSPEGQVAGMLRHHGRLHRGEPFVPLEGGAESLEEGLREGKGLSPFLREEVLRLGWDEVRRRFEEGPPVLSFELGAYPYKPAQWEEVSTRPQTSLSTALETYYRLFLERLRLAQRRQSLLGQLKRSIQRLEQGARHLKDSLSALNQAEIWQRQAELLLAFGAGLEKGSGKVILRDWEGNPVEISLDPRLSGVENAEALFVRAKRARREKTHVKERLDRIHDELEELRAVMSLVESGNEEDIERGEQLAERKGWLPSSPALAPQKEKPFEGQKVKALVSPNGWSVLVGGNAEANDYLIRRLAKPYDWWFHVRTGKGAHVLLQTQGHPQKVQKEDMLFAARLAARESTWRHSEGVPVDYVLARYVRKPRKAPSGMVVYTHEKTLYVDP